MRDQSTLFHQRIKDPKAFMDDAQHLAFTMVRNGVREPEDALELQMSVEYWQYVREFHPHYLERVKNKAREIAKALGHNFHDHPEKFPLPQGDQGGDMGGGGGMGAPPPPGGDAGGAPPPAAASARGMEKTAAGTVYLKSITHHGKFWLSSTWAAKFCSKWPYPTPQGGMAMLSFSNDYDEEIRVPRAGHSVRTAMRMESELPTVMTQAITELVARHKLNVPADKMTVFCHEFMNIPLRDQGSALVALQSGPMAALTLSNPDNPNIEEPAIAEEARTSIGAALAPFMSAFMSALKMDGIQVEQELSKMPAYTKIAKQAEAALGEQERQSNEQEIAKLQPGLLSTVSAVAASRDMHSLKLTISFAATAKEQNNIELAEAALNQVSFLMQYDWEAYSRSPVSAELAAEYERTAPRIQTVSGAAPAKVAAGTLVTLVAASEADTPRFAEMLTSQHYEIKQSMINLALQQKRKDILKAFPKYARVYFGAGMGYSVNLDMVDTLDPKDQWHLEEIRSLAELEVGDIYYNPYRERIANKVQDALIQTNDQRLYNACYYKGSANKLRDFARGVGLSSPNPEVRQRALKDMWQSNDKRTDHNAYLLAALAVKNMAPENSEEIAKMLAEAVKIDPRRLAVYAGYETAAEYAKLARVGDAGEGLPEATELAEMPGNALAMAKNYAVIGDYAAMLMLFKVCAETISQNREIQTEDSGLTYAMSYMYQTLEKNGMKAHADEILRSQRVILDSGGTVRHGPSAMIPAEQVSAEHIHDALFVGDFATAAKLLASVYKANPDAAFEILQKTQQPQDPKMFISMLPRQMLSQKGRLPPWVRPAPTPDIEASVLPDGTVLVKTGGTYSIMIGDERVSFQADPSQAARIAMERIAESKGIALIRIN